jgi:hypothetical protein
LPDENVRIGKCFLRMGFLEIDRRDLTAGKGGSVERLAPVASWQGRGESGRLPRQSLAR